MLEPVRQLPERSVQGGGDADFLAPLSDGAVHEIDFCLALSQNVLQHAGAVLAGGVGAFLNELSWIPMKFDSHLCGNSFALVDQIIEQLTRRSEARGGAMGKHRTATTGLR